MALPVELGLYLAIYFCIVCPLLLVARPLVAIGQHLLKFSAVSAFLDSATDHLRFSVECDIVGSFPGVPLILAALFDEEIPQGFEEDRRHQKRLRKWQRSLQWEFYVRQYRAGRISKAQFYTFTDDPRAAREHEKEDLEFYKAYQEKMASHHHAAGASTVDRSTCRPISRQRVMQSSAPTLSTPPPPPPPQQPFLAGKKLRGTLPRDAKGNIIWGRNYLFEEYLAQQPRRDPAGPCCAYHARINNAQQTTPFPWYGTTITTTNAPVTIVPPPPPPPPPPPTIITTTPPTLNSPPNPRQAIGTTTPPPPVAQPLTITPPPLKFLSADNPLASLASLDLCTAQIATWTAKIKDTLADNVSVAQLKGKYDEPGAFFTDACSNAEAWCRWTHEFAINEDGKWDTQLVSYRKALEMGIKGKWWKELGAELEEMKGTRKRKALASAGSPFVKLFAQFDKVDALFPRGWRELCK